MKKDLIIIKECSDLGVPHLSILDGWWIEEFNGINGWAYGRTEVDGCGSSTVCGSFVAELALGNTPDELVEITVETILKIPGSFPEENRHCAFLAADTLQDALNDYMIKGTRKAGEEQLRLKKRLHGNEQSQKIKGS